jgi:hypothetical protein
MCSGISTLTSCTLYFIGGLEQLSSIQPRCRVLGHLVHVVLGVAWSLWSKQDGAGPHQGLFSNQLLIRHKTRKKG